MGDAGKPSQIPALPLEIQEFILSGFVISYIDLAITIPSGHRYYLPEGIVHAIDYSSLSGTLDQVPVQLGNGAHQTDITEVLDFEDDIDEPLPLGSCIANLCLVSHLFCETVISVLSVALGIEKESNISLRENPLTCLKRFRSVLRHPQAIEDPAGESFGIVGKSPSALMHAYVCFEFVKHAPWWHASLRMQGKSSKEDCEMRTHQFIAACHLFGPLLESVSDKWPLWEPLGDRVTDWDLSQMLTNKFVSNASKIAQVLEAFDPSDLCTQGSLQHLIQTVTIEIQSCKRVGRSAADVACLLDLGCLGPTLDMADHLMAVLDVAIMAFLHFETVGSRLGMLEELHTVVDEIKSTNANFKTRPPAVPYRCLF